MADEEFEDVRGTRHVCRGFDGGLRKAVRVDSDTAYAIGDHVTFVVDAVVSAVEFRPHEDDEDEDEDGEGLDRLHISRLAVVTVVDTPLFGGNGQGDGGDELEDVTDAERAAMAVMG